MEWLQDVRLCVLVVAHKKIGHKRGCSKFEPWSPGWSIFSDTHVFKNSMAIRETMISSVVLTQSLENFKRNSFNFNIFKKKLKMDITWQHDLE